MNMNMINNNNTYYYIDYNQQIIPVKNDMRTSYDFGHRHQIATGNIGPPDVSIPDRCRTMGTKWMNNDYSTESRSEFYYKTNNTFDQRAERSMSCRNEQFVQTQQERMFAHPPKAINATQSNYQRDYPVPVQQYSEPFVQTNRVYTCPEKAKNIIYANAPGSLKYQDPYATTNMLNHPQHSIDQQNGIGRKDALTLWDWMEYPKGKGYGLKFYPVKQRCAKVPFQDRQPFKLMMFDRIVPNRRSIVPHNGMRTECQAEFVRHAHQRNSDIGFGCPIPMPYVDLCTESTEYSSYNSGKRISV